MRVALFALIAVGAVWAASAEDSYLYWMVNSTAVGAYDYDRVQVRAVNEQGTDNLLSLYWSDDAGAMNPYENTTWITASDVQNTQGGLGFYASLANAMGNNYSYVIELFKGDKFLAQSTDALSYANATEYIETVGAGTGLSELAKAWSPASYAVPEPNSALLLLLGCAGLALRRRRLMHA